MPFNNPTILIDKLNESKTVDLKEWCKLYSIKQSKNGVTNKYVMRKNIFEYELRRKPTEEEEKSIDFG